MKLAVAVAAAALGATGVAAYADQADHIVIRHHDMMMDIDANHDGWITRAEAAAAADRMFDRLDTNHDGRLTDADRPMHEQLDVDVAGPGGVPAPDDRNCTRTVEPAPDGHGQRVTVICQGSGEGGGTSERRVIIRRGDHDTPHAESGAHVEREVTIVTRDNDDAAAPETPEAPAAPAPPAAPHALHAPLAPHPPHPPMFMMLMANSDEMDTNHDGAISRDEFRAQQLRFFDASDANGDGRIRFEPPPEPPAPPPAPPESSVN